MSSTTATSPAPPVTPPAAPPTAAERNHHSFGQWFRQAGWRYIIVLLALVFGLFPLLYVISAALSTGGTMTGSNKLFAAFDPSNFKALFADPYFFVWVRNTLVVTITVAVASVLMGAAAAYAFSRFRFRGRRGGLTFLLIVQMFPQMLAFVAIYLLLLTLGNVLPSLGLNSLLGLITVYLGGALGSNTFLMYGFFNTVPREIDEAARIDGASHSRIFFTIILRLTIPILAVVCLLSFVSSFGEYMIAKLVLTSKGNWTLAVGMYSWVSDQLNANWGLFAAGAVLAAIPIVVLFIFLQKYIVGGLTAGAVKG